MSEFIKQVGWAIIVIGVISGLYIGFTLNISTPGLTEGYVYEDPHPFRWIYGIGAILSSLFFGCVLIGINEIIEKINSVDKEVRYTGNNIQREIKEIQQTPSN
ncbi:hypothetical protein [Fictibacillus sp. JL2B1089]|uniref:hypothetical protein n=1 Tax=Fictibacillus sp. JL2B1089 TaxID=3399565 RepID=UPI003A8BBA95